MPAAAETSSKVPTARVVEQLVVLHACDEKVRMAVVVVVADGRTCRVPDAGDAGALRHIREVKVAVVVVQAVPVGRRLLGERWEGGAVGEEDVRPTVAVVVEHGEPARHRLDHVLVGRAVLLQDEVESRFVRDVLELDGASGWCVRGFKRGDAQAAPDRHGGERA